MENVSALGRNVRSDDSGISQQLVVPRRQSPELHPKDGRLELVKASVVPDDRVVVADALTVFAERTELLRELIVVGHDASGLAVRAQILAAIEGERRRASSAAGHATGVEAAAVGLARVF